MGATFRKRYVRHLAVMRAENAVFLENVVSRQLHVLRCRC
jgi:hypothetical protein